MVNFLGPSWNISKFWGQKWNNFGVKWLRSEILGSTNNFEKVVKYLRGLFVISDFWNPLNQSENDTWHYLILSFFFFFFPLFLSGQSEPKIQIHSALSLSSMCTNDLTHPSVISLSSLSLFLSSSLMTSSVRLAPVTSS